MKILSKTENGGRVVELSRSEFRELYTLAQTCDDSVLDEYSAVWSLSAFGDRMEKASEMFDDFDFTKLFSVVRAWRVAKFSVNELKSLISGIEKAIMQNDPE